MNQKLLVVVVGENDKWQDMPLYEAITRKLIQLKAPGATVQRGIMGYGSHQKRLHHGQLFGISDDRPVTISVVHEEEALRTLVIPSIQALVRQGLMFMIDVEFIPFEKKPAGAPVTSSPPPPGRD
jgi:PII-like signaling protein